MKFSVGDKVQCIGVLHNEVYATNGLVGAVGEVVRGNSFGSTVAFDVATTKDNGAHLWCKYGMENLRYVANDELILLPEEEQPSFEEELLKLFGGE